jgi:exocyst complex component 2
MYSYLCISHRCVPVDANLFYHLESWTVESEEPTATSFPLQFEHFQRHLTISAYKVAVATESSFAPAPFTTRDIQNPPISRKKSRVMPPVFINKLTKTFMDAIYAFLDGLVLLATEDSPNMRALDKFEHVRGTAHEMRLHDLLDLRDTVSDGPF